MYLSSMFLAALGEHFEPSDIKRAFSKTNQHFMIQENVSEEEIQDLLDVCQEFLPQTFLTEKTEYRKLLHCLETAFFQRLHRRI